MKKLLVSALFLSSVGAVNAQSAFQGFYGQIATGYESNRVTNLNTTDNGSTNAGRDTFSTNASSPSQTFGGAPLVLGLGYNFSVAPKWLLGIGVDYSALSQTSSSFTQTLTSAFDNGVPVSEDIGATLPGNSVKVSNRVNIFLTPGYEIDKDKLVYLKAGYSMANVKFQGGTTVNFPDGTSGSGPAFNGNKNVSGFILGLGYKQIISGGLYGFAEGNYMSYGKANISSSFNDGDSTSTSSINPSLNSYQLLVGVGYRF